MIDIDEFLEKEMDRMKSQDIEPEAPRQAAGIEDMFNEIRDLIEQNRFNQAEGLYSTVRTLIEKKEAGEKIKFYEQLSKINKEFVNRLNKLSADIDKKTELINVLISKGKDAMKKKDLDLATRTYKEIQKAYDDIPNEFLNKKMHVQNDIFEFYRELKDKKDKESLSDFNAAFNKINIQINKVNDLIKMRQLDKAMNIYRECVALYENLPHGFIKQKSELYTTILKVHEEINLTLDIMHLQSQLVQLQEPILEEKKAPELVDRAMSEVIADEKKVEQIEADLKAMPEETHKSAIKSAETKEIKNEIQDIEATKKNIQHEIKRLVVERRTQRAIYALNKGYYQQAFKDLKQVLVMDPDNEAAKEMLLKIKGKRPHILEHIADEREEVVPAIVEKPMQEPRRNNFEVLSSMKKINHEEPKSGLHQNRMKEMAIFEINKGFYKKASKHLREILAHDPGNTEVNSLLSKIGDRK